MPIATSGMCAELTVQVVLYPGSSEVIIYRNPRLDEPVWSAGAWRPASHSSPHSGPRSDLQTVIDLAAGWLDAVSLELAVLVGWSQSVTVAPATRETRLRTLIDLSSPRGTEADRLELDLLVGTVESPTLDRLTATAALFAGVVPQRRRRITPLFTFTGAAHLACALACSRLMSWWTTDFAPSALVAVNTAADHLLAIRKETR